jgi:hypothetical protein
VKLRTLRAPTQEGGIGWGRTGSWLGWLRAARLLLHRDELEALLELDIVKGPLAEARGPASLSFLAGGHPLARNLDLRQRLVALLGMTRAALGAGILALLLAASVLATGSNVWFGVQDASEAAAVLGSPR